ncbi:AAA family ATPase [Pseudobacillus badius]|uniref:AAA family ATPase n=1 Tax=Bacillus badius TaxID=1455 RepID=UPI0007B07A2A|nr:AAA family ATPase [Bacillus badius]KZN99236.1 hypothetical protein A4244_19490 [Bacillus badius]OCS84200.1 hypothetical protein A6M11_19505 [Bacillus badius]OVE46405.1 hypothetical protein B1A98_19555 [Bacillus badius]TDV97928.1 AAA ATPase-like protein [Bacillus badius]
MELIYLWVDNYRNIQNVGFNFSSRFNVHYKMELGKEYPILKIEKNYTVPKLFDQKVDQITAIIGKNGSGKTNILDILGAKRYDRQSLGNYRDLKYFIIYHLESNLFAIEGSNFEFIKNNIKEYANGENINHITEPYSIIVELEEEQLSYKGFLQFGSGVAYKDNINFFSFRHRYNGDAYRHYQSMTIENEPSHLFNRINLNNKNTGNSAIYEMIIDLNKKKLTNQEDSFMFAFKNNIYLTISPNMHLIDSLDLKLKEGFEEKINLLKPNDPQFKFNPKVDFINRFLYDFCHSLASQFFSSQQMEKQLSKIRNVTQEFTVEQENYYSYYLQVISTILGYQEEIDKYFKHKQQILDFMGDLIKNILKFDQEWFSNNRINIPLQDNHDESINNFLKILDNLNFIDEEVQSLIKVFSINFHPFSAGEEALMSLFAALHYALKLEYHQTRDKAIILLDEPDNFMHPEWSRLLVKELCSFLNRLENGYQSYQIVITTHSPFIISDLPKENVISLDKDLETGKCKIVPIVETFASNIHTLLAQDFFMSSTIGEFAKYKINKVIDLLNSSDLHLLEQKKEEIDYIISIIGEPLIKNKLKYMAETSFWKEERIKQLRERILELENNDTDKE